MHAVEGQHLIVRPDPENPYDENACRVDTGSGETLGYVPKALAGRLRATGSGPWPASVHETWVQEVAGLWITILDPAVEPIDHWIALTGPDHELLEPAAGDVFDLDAPMPASRASVADVPAMSESAPPTAPVSIVEPMVTARSGRNLGVFVSKGDGRVRVREEDGLEVDYPEGLVICPDMDTPSDITPAVQ